MNRLHSFTKDHCEKAVFDIHFEDTEILKKFNYSDVKSASTPVDLEKPLVKDGDADDVDVHLYRSMIGSLMYLTTSRPDIMFAGFSIELVAYTDSDYAGATQDRKSTTGGYLLTKGFNAGRFQYLVSKIIDFLKASSVHYALTVNPIIYTSCIEQFWATKKVQTVNGVRQLQALVDKKKVIIMELSIRSDLHLDDAEGTDCLPTATIFEELTRMGYEKPSQKLTFYKAFFSV
ncbi:putative ribonuclease H-like domain-containing protein [Tanacetum coccineum]